MTEGAFALIDCLGFKGIWKTADPALVLKKLLALEQLIPNHITSEPLSFEKLSFGPVRANVRLLSDTVAISLQYEHQKGKTPNESQKNNLVALICLSVIQVLDLFIKGEPPLVLRGCISYGEHLSESNFIVGPAVDDAAEHMHQADGAFVWLHPIAADRYRVLNGRMSESLSNVSPELLIKIMNDQKFEGKFSSMQEWVGKYGEENVAKTLLSILRPLASVPLVIDPYNMPLKSGAGLRCAILNPLALHTSGQERREIIQRYSRVISGNRMDIWLKRQNTMEMLEAANCISANFDKILERMKAPGSTDKTEE